VNDLHEFKQPVLNTIRPSLTSSAASASSVWLAAVVAMAIYYAYQTPIVSRLLNATGDLLLRSPPT
jgi:hypothetical protein